MQLLFVINCAHFPLRRDKLHLKLIIPNFRWALCDIRKLQKVRFAAVSEVEPLRTGAKWSQPSQAKPSWARPGPWVFGASQSVKICCQCCNLFIYFSSFFASCFCCCCLRCCCCCCCCCVWLSTKMYNQHEEEPIGRRLRVHIVYFTHLLARRRYCAPPFPPLPAPRAAAAPQLRLQLELHPLLGAASNWLVLSCRTFSS